MTDDLRFPHTRVPRFLNRGQYPGLNASRAATYVAARSYAYTKSKCSENFARCLAPISKIGEVFGQGRRTVERNLAWLERAGLLYRARRFNNSSVIAFVDFPERFRATAKSQNLEAAIGENEESLGAITAEARRERAREAGERTGTSGALSTKVNGTERNATSAALTTRAKPAGQRGAETETPPVPQGYATSGVSPAPRWHIKNYRNTTSEPLEEHDATATAAAARVCPSPSQKTEVHNPGPRTESVAKEIEQLIRDTFPEPQKVLDGYQRQNIPLDNPVLVAWVRSKAAEVNTRH